MKKVPFPVPVLKLADIRFACVTAIGVFAGQRIES